MHFEMYGLGDLKVIHWVPLANYPRMHSIEVLATLPYLQQ